jgi:serine/threonine protein phosphatase PrpC
VIVFAANPPQVKAGDSVTLSWKVTGGVSRVTLNNQEVKPIASKKLSGIQSEATYTLTAIGPRGQIVTRTIGVPISMSTPVVTVFTATPAKIQEGQSAVLKWAVRNANAIRIEPVLGGAKLPSTGSRTVSPPVTTTFKLTASGAAGQAGAKASVTVLPRPKLPGRIASFESDKSEVKAGDTATLSWKVTGDVRSVTLDNGIGPVKPVDHTSVTPTSKTIYTLAVTDAEGITSTAVVTIDIAQDPKIELFEADVQVWVLRWRITETGRGGTRSTIEPRIGKVGGSCPTDGMPVRSPPPDHYALSTERSGGTIPKRATLQSQAAVMQMHTQDHMSAGPDSVFQTARVCEKGGRPNNEDFCDFLQVDNSILWLVADGLGGHNGGELASRTAVENALESFRDDPEVSASALERHIVVAQEAILTTQREDPAVAGMRTTLVALISDSHKAIWGHVGDSRLYRFQARGLVAQTEDHSVPQSLVKAGEISPDDIRHHPDRSRLLRSLGEQGPARVSIMEGQSSLNDADAFLLCTDGFWENVLEIEMLADLVASASPEEWLDRSTSRLRARVRGDHDNYCALGIFCHPAHTTRVSPTDAPESVRTDGPNANRLAQLDNLRSQRLVAPAPTPWGPLLEERPFAAAREAAWIWV